MGDDLGIERLQIEVEIEYANHVLVLDDRLRQVQRLQAEVRALGGQARRLATLGAKFPVACELGLSGIEDRRAAHVGQALEGGEHARRSLLVEEHQARGGVVGEHAGHHTGVALERERADHQAAEGDHQREQAHGETEGSLIDPAQLLAEAHAGVVRGGGGIIGRQGCDTRRMAERTLRWLPRGQAGGES